MRRIRDDFPGSLTNVMGLLGSHVLEIGSGDGFRSKYLAECCRTLIGVEPSARLIEMARSRKIPRAVFFRGSAEALPSFPQANFDVAIFTLSFHHVPVPQMAKAIDGVISVVKPEGHIIFFEPTTKGSFFDAEIKFDICDGDEREAKHEARKAMHAHPKLTHIRDVTDETIFETTPAGFRIILEPKKNVGEVRDFLVQHNYTLQAQHRLSIFQIKS